MAYGIQINSANTAGGTITSTTDTNLHPGVLLQQGYVTLTSVGGVSGFFNFFWTSGTVVVDFSANAGTYTNFSIVVNNTGSGGTYDNSLANTTLSPLGMTAAPTVAFNPTAKTATFTLGPTFRVNLPGFESGSSVKLVNNYYYLIFGIG
jgi:hypothetical protein